MAQLYIRGEAGATLGPERQPIGQLRIRDAALRLTSLDIDELTWTARTGDVAAGETVLPDVGQRVSLYLDEERLFRGTVADAQVLLYGVRVRVVGPWWWLRRVDAVSEILDAGSTLAERPTLRFPQAAVEDSLSAVIGLARDGYGLPIREGTIEPIYQIPTVSYPLQTLADVIAKLCEWCADAVPYFDYSADRDSLQAATASTVTLAATASATDDDYNGLEIEMRSGAAIGETRTITDYDGATRVATLDTAWTTTPAAGDDYALETEPAFCVARRGSMPTTTLELGVDPLVEPFEFRPLIEWQVSQVSLTYAARDGTTGQPVWRSQEAGTYQTGKRQIIPVSGPEIMDFLPADAADDFDSYERDAGVWGPTSLRQAALAFAPALQTPKSQGLGSFSIGTNTATVTLASGFDGVTDTLLSYTSQPTTVVDALGVAVNMADKLLVLSPNPPQWWIDEVGAIQVTITAELLVRVREQFYDAFGQVAGSDPLPNWFASLAPTRALSGWWGGSDGGSSFVDNRNRGAWWSKIVTFQTYVIPATAGSGQFTQLPAQQYAFATPPADLASNMLAASDWLPWEGVVTRQLDSLAGGQHFASSYQLVGTVPAAASAGALLRSYELDLSARRASYTFGPPARLTYRALINRVQRNPQDGLIVL